MFVTTVQLIAIWKAKEDLAENPAFGTELVQAMGTTGHQPAFLAACYADDYRDGIHRLNRFKQFGSCEDFRFEEANDQFLVYKE